MVWVGAKVRLEPFFIFDRRIYETIEGSSPFHGCGVEVRVRDDDS